MITEAERALNKELLDGEHLLWSTAPRQGFILRPADAIVIPFSMMWSGFAFFWEFSVVTSGKAPFFFMIWGIPFVLVGIYFVIGRFLVDIYQRKRTYYGLSNRRIFILNGIWNRVTKTLLLQNLAEISIVERSDGSGTITFGATPAMFAGVYGGAWLGSRNNLLPMFEQIENVRDVYKLIDKAQHPAQIPAQT